MITIQWFSSSIFLKDKCGKAGPVRLEQIIQVVDGPSQPLEQGEGPVRYVGPVLRHLHAPVAKLNCPENTTNNGILTFLNLRQKKGSIFFFFTAVDAHVSPVRIYFLYL